MLVTRPELGDQADVCSPAAAGIARVRLDVELDGLTLFQVIEPSRGQRRGVKKDFLVRVAGLDEAESAVTDDAGDLSGCQC